MPPSTTLLRHIALIPGVKVEQAASLARLTTFGIGGEAALLLTAESTEAVLSLRSLLADEGISGFPILGGGSNLLADSRGVAGPVSGWEGIGTKCF